MMTTTTTRSSREDEEDLPLPPLQIADIDQATLRDLLSDVDALGVSLEIVLRRASDTHVDPSNACPFVEEAMQQLCLGTACAVQLHYTFQGVRWCDTLMRTPAGFRLVRIQECGARAGDCVSMK